MTTVRISLFADTNLCDGNGLDLQTKKKRQSSKANAGNPTKEV